MSCESCCEFEVEHINTTQEKITIKIIDGTPEMIIDKQQTTHITKKFTLVKNAHVTTGSSIVPDLCNMFIDAFLYVNDKAKCDTHAPGHNTKYDIELDLGVEKVHGYTASVDEQSQLGGKHPNIRGSPSTYPGMKPPVRMDKKPHRFKLDDPQSLQEQPDIMPKEVLINYIINTNLIFIGLSRKGLGFVVKNDNEKLKQIINNCFHKKLNKQ